MVSTNLVTLPTEADCFTGFEGALETLYLGLTSIYRYRYRQLTLVVSVHPGERFARQIREGLVGFVHLDRSRIE